MKKEIKTISEATKNDLLIAFDISEDENKLYMYGRRSFGLILKGVKIEVDGLTLTITSEDV